MSEIVPKDNLREFFKRWPHFYVFAVHAFGPAYLGGFGPRKFLRHYFPAIDEHPVLSFSFDPFSLISFQVKQIDFSGIGLNFITGLF